MEGIKFDLELEISETEEERLTKMIEKALNSGTSFTREPNPKTPGQYQTIHVLEVISRAAHDHSINGETGKALAEKFISTKAEQGITSAAIYEEIGLLDFFNILDKWVMDRLGNEILHQAPESTPTIEKISKKIEGINKNLSEMSVVDSIFSEKANGNISAHRAGILAIIATRKLATTNLLPADFENGIRALQSQGLISEKIAEKLIERFYETSIQPGVFTKADQLKESAEIKKIYQAIEDGDFYPNWEAAGDENNPHLFHYIINSPLISTAAKRKRLMIFCINSIFKKQTYPGETIITELNNATSHLAANGKELHSKEKDEKIKLLKELRQEMARRQKRLTSPLKVFIPIPQKPTVEIRKMIAALLIGLGIGSGAAYIGTANNRKPVAKATKPFATKLTASENTSTPDAASPGIAYHDIESEAPDSIEDTVTDTSQNTKAEKDIEEIIKTIEKSTKKIEPPTDTDSAITNIEADETSAIKKITNNTEAVNAAESTESPSVPVTLFLKTTISGEILLSKKLTAQSLKNNGFTVLSWETKPANEETYIALQTANSQKFKINLQTSLDSCTPKSTKCQATAVPIED